MLENSQINMIDHIVADLHKYVKEKIAKN